MRGKSIFVGAIAVLVLATGCVPAEKNTPTPAPTSEPSTSQRRVWVSDKSNYTSPWYDGAHPIMIGFGCTPAPYYDPDPACKNNQGFHHGIDVMMDCGTKLYAGVDGTVVSPKSAGKLGLAYGKWAFRIRTDNNQDIVIGHVRTVYVKAGQAVKKGTLIALSSDAGPPSSGGKTPDGCHFHFEVRPAKGKVSTAVNPVKLLALKKAS